MTMTLAEKLVWRGCMLERQGLCEDYKKIQNRQIDKNAIWCMM